jgi:hypothetical protein
MVENILGIEFENCGQPLILYLNGEAAAKLMTDEQWAELGAAIKANSLKLQPKDILIGEAQDKKTIESIV